MLHNVLYVAYCAFAHISNICCILCCMLHIVCLLISVAYVAYLASVFKYNLQHPFWANKSYQLFQLQTSLDINITMEVLILTQCQSHCRAVLYVSNDIICKDHIIQYIPCSPGSVL